MGNKKDSLGDRMKRYENVPKVHLVRRMPVIIRLDGKAFHTFTRGFVKPFDKELVMELAESCQLLVTMEDNVYSGGFSESVQAFLQGRLPARCLSVCLPDDFIGHGSPEELYARYKMDAASVAERIMKKL